MEKPIIGLTGGMCSGKDVWAKFLVDQFGFGWQGTSDIAREYITENQLGDPTRDLVRETCTDLRNKNGADYLAKEALRRLDVDKPRVISGIYTLSEVEYIKTQGGKLINISTEEDLLLARMANRGRAGEKGAKNEFDRLMNNDLCAKDTDQRLADVIGLADAEIDGSIPITNIEQCRRIALQAFQELGISDVR